MNAKKPKKSFRALVALAILAFLCPHPVCAAASPVRPNIVLVLADDLGWMDVGYQGAAFVKTPNIDRLAREGMTFTNGYAAAGNCMPSRVCMISGTYTPRHGVYAVGSTQRGPLERMRLVPVPNKSGLAEENVTMAEALKGAGYATGIFGKWHLDGPDGAPPEKQGFDTVFQSAPGWSKKEKDNPKGVRSLTRAACEFITRHKDEPFFVYLPHYAIHSPLQATSETLKSYQNQDSAHQDPPALYAACIADLDASVGTLLEHISSLGLENNTLLVFTSDNGAVQQSSQEPLRGSKGGYYEGGIREPFIIRWPGKVKPGGKCDTPVVQVDLYPTFLEVAGAATPVGKVLDGESLVPLLKGDGTLKRSSIYWHFPGYLDQPVNRGRECDARDGFRSRPVSVIRKGDWKLHLFHEEWVLEGGRSALDSNHAVELYNMARDPGEKVDLALTEKSRRDDLLDDLLAWVSAVKAPIPDQRNPDFGKPAGKVRTKRSNKTGKHEPSDHP